MPEIERPHEVQNMNLVMERKKVIYKGKQAGKAKSAKAG
jgi:hypothetical protein